MESLYNDQSVKKYFLLPQKLSKKAEKVSNELGINFSELVRKALEKFIGEIEGEKIKMQIAEACEFYYNIDKEIASDWRSAEGDI